MWVVWEPPQGSVSVTGPHLNRSYLASSGSCKAGCGWDSEGKQGLGAFGGGIWDQRCNEMRWARVGESQEALRVGGGEGRQVGCLIPSRLLPVRTF